MKKIVFVVVVFLSVVLCACKQEPVITKYTIGCLEYYGSSNWETIQNYLAGRVDLNKVVEFEGASLSENDAQAKNYYKEQLAKIDQEQVCSMLKEPDYYVYGIKTVNADGTYRYIAATKFTASGASDYTE